MLFERNFDFVAVLISKLWPFCHTSDEIIDRHRSVTNSSMSALIARPKQQRQKNQATEWRPA
jgi:hypothetical protein